MGLPDKVHGGTKYFFYYYISWKAFICRLLIYVIPHKRRTCIVFIRYLNNWTPWCNWDTNIFIFRCWKHCASITSKLLSVIEHKNNNGNYNNWVLVVHYLVCKDALVPLVKRFVWLSGSIRAVRHASRNRIRYLTYMHLI